MESSGTMPRSTRVDPRPAAPLRWLTQRSAPVLTGTLFLTLLFGALDSRVGLAVEPGETPFIYGMHDEPDRALFERDGCGRGWITTLRYIGDDGQCETIDYSSWADAGWGVIMRLDYGTPAQPPYENQWDGYAAGIVDCIQKSKGIKVWVVGNEPNIPWGHPEGRPFTPQEYGEIYRRAVAAVDAAGLQDHIILFGAMAPWAALDPWGDWDDGWGAAVDYVRNNGGYIDGVAIHAYTRNDMSAGAISSDAWFPGREGKWRLHFRGYRDTTEMLAARNIYDIPLFITESGNACDPPCTPYQDADVGYFYAMFDEIRQWNRDNPRQVIRGVTPYRWTGNDDGSGRDFEIGNKPGLTADISRAVDQGWTWSDTGCSNQPQMCTPDCAGKACGNDGCGGSCGTCNSPLVCSPDGQCVDVSPSDTGMGTDTSGGADTTSPTDTAGTSDTGSGSTSDAPNPPDTTAQIDTSADTSASNADSGEGVERDLPPPSDCACTALRHQETQQWPVGGLSLLISLISLGLVLRRRL